MNKKHAPVDTAVLVVNLGTPEAPDRRSVRKFLKEFLWDRRVVEVPRLIWWFVLNFVILNTRPATSAKAYQSVWQKEGSPLMFISRRQESALQHFFDEKLQGKLLIRLSMRYGQPSIDRVISELQGLGVKRLVVLPMYPQYSATTTASVFDAVADSFKKRRDIPALHLIRSWAGDPAYIEALATSIENHWQQYGQSEMLVFSFHGIPQEYNDAGDPYYEECQLTARLLRIRLGLNDTNSKVTFQSRLGPKQWLQPYTDKSLQALAEEGIKNVQIICPGFSVDCLETLEEIAQENCEIFMHAGGKTYQYIPCLNDDPEHIKMLAGIVCREISGWQLEDSLQGISK